MSDNLLALAQQALGTDFSSLAGQFLGESESATQSAMRGLLPAVLGMVAQKGATAQGASSLLAQLGNSGLDANLLGNVAGMLGGGNASVQSLLKLGSETLVPALFGDKAGPLVSSLSSAAGLKTSSATNLIALVVPMIFAFLKKYVGEKKLDAGGLASLLGNQGSFLSNALDSRITGALGFASPAAFLGSLGSAGDTAKRAGAAVGDRRGDRRHRGRGHGCGSDGRGQVGVHALAAVDHRGGRPVVPVEHVHREVVATAGSGPEGLGARRNARRRAGERLVPGQGLFRHRFRDGRSGQRRRHHRSRRGDQEGRPQGRADRLHGQDGRRRQERGARQEPRDRGARRAQAAGAPEASITLQPPVFVEVGAGGNDAEARRVEIVKQ